MLLTAIESARVPDDGERCHTPHSFDAKAEREVRMKRIAFVVGLVVAAISVAPAPASARGCLKGAVVGGVLGHFAGHHGLVGAGAGCMVGHHYANRHYRERMRDRYDYR